MGSKITVVMDGEPLFEDEMDDDHDYEANYTHNGTNLKIEVEG